jgi:hypothetical protein
MDLRLKTIASFLTPGDAEVARLVLEDAGISTTLENATTVGMLWYYGNAVGWVKLQVPEASAQRAREILEQKTGDSGTIRFTRTCPKCGADLPAEFEVCWSCQSPLSEDAAEAQPAPQMPVGDDIKETDAGDDLAWRACRAAVLGAICCPPLLTFYSGWLLLRLAGSDLPLSRSGNRNRRFAVFVNLMVCLLIGLWITHIY